MCNYICIMVTFAMLQFQQIKKTRKITTTKQLNTLLSQHYDIEIYLLVSTSVTTMGLENCIRKPQGYSPVPLLILTVLSRTGRCLKMMKEMFNKSSKMYICTAGKKGIELITNFLGKYPMYTIKPNMYIN